MKLILRDIRCFHGYHEVEVRPLTFLVGENSSGKTTFLAALSAVLRQTPFPFAPGLSQPPYEITGFDSVASDHGGSAGRAETFALGYFRDTQKYERRLVASYADNFGQPTLETIEIDSEGTEIRLQFNVDRVVVSLGEKKTDAPTKTLTVPIPKHRDFQVTPQVLGPSFFHSIYQRAREEKLAGQLISVLERNLFFPFAARRMDSLEPLSIAPIRTKPLPAYPQATDQYAPEGDHIPLLLARLFDRQTSLENEHSKVTDALGEFGENSGLFRELRVKRLGSKQSDPFQLMVKIATQTSNISDVGYGVSQSLPVVVQSITAPNGQRLLIQQPEVHLHPRAQAAMGSLFVQLKRKDRKEFIVETHSDYMIDRVRRHVASGDVAASDVMILFFERKGRETEVHPIRLDETGNILDAPEAYRAFFIEEQIALLSGESKTDVPNS